MRLTIENPHKIVGRWPYVFIYDVEVTDDAYVFVCREPYYATKPNQKIRLTLDRRGRHFGWSSIAYGFLIGGKHIHMSPASWLSDINNTVVVVAEALRTVCNNNINKTI